jgi:hypothetical protein
MKGEMGESSSIAFIALYLTQRHCCVGMAAHVALAKQ